MDELQAQLEDLAGEAPAPPAHQHLNGLADGALFGNPGQLVTQGTAVLTAIVYSFVVSFILLKLIGLVMPLRVSSADESVGLDISGHGEEAYLHAEGGSQVLSKTELGYSGTPVMKPVTAD